MGTGLGRGWWLGAAASGALMVLWLVSGASSRVELPLRDLVLKARPSVPARHVAVVAVDDTALARFGPWPWSRQRLAEVVAATHRAGGRGVAVDLLLAEPSDDDASLAAALASRPAWLVGALQADTDRWLLPSATLRRAGRLTHGALELDHDGVLRSLAGTKQAEELALPALALALAREIDSTLAVPVGRTLLPDFRTGPGDVPVVSTAEVLTGAPTTRVLGGRLVLLGVTATGLGDRVVTPRSGRDHPDPGVLAHAAAAECLIARAVLWPLPPVGTAVLAVALVGLTGLVSRLGGWPRLVSAVAVVLVPGVVGVGLLLGTGVALPVASLTVLALGAVLAADAGLALRTWRAMLTTAQHLRHGEGLRGTPRERMALLESLAAEAAREAASETEARRVTAHELKTPLTSLRGLSELLRDYDLDPEEQKHVADLVHREAARLHAMVDTLLDLEHLQLRHFDREAALVDLRGLTAGRAEALSRGSGRSIRLEVGPEANVMGVPELLARVLDNLLGNALKYSPEGAPVLVRVRCLDGDAVLEIEDRGPGVPPEEREHIFRRFQRGTSASGQPGLGLGLALVSEVVAWHRGRVTVEAAAAGGSVFRVRLPAAP